MSDQATSLRALARAAHHRPRILTVTSGKGGVGKTNVLVNVAIALQQRGHRVVVVDADLGLANVDIVLGLKPEFTLQHVVDGVRPLADVVIPGPGGIRVVPGCNGIPRIADLSARKRREMLQGFSALEAETDFILIDTAAGLGRNVVQFALAADEVLIVTTPEPSAVTDAYAMIKVLQAASTVPAIRLVVNVARSGAQAQEIAEKITSVSHQFLQVRIQPLGYVMYDDHVRRAVMQQRPVLLHSPHSPAARAFRAIAEVVDTGAGARAMRRRGGLLERLTGLWRRSPVGGGEALLPANG